MNFFNNKRFGYPEKFLKATIKHLNRIDDNGAYNLIGLRSFIREFRTFALTWPRQTGKTTAIIKYITDDDLLVVRSGAILDSAIYSSVRHKIAKTYDVNALVSQKFKYIYFDDVREVDREEIVTKLIELEVIDKDSAIISMCT